MCITWQSGDYVVRHDSRDNINLLAQVIRVDDGGAKLAVVYIDNRSDEIQTFTMLDNYSWQNLTNARICTESDYEKYATSLQGKELSRRMLALIDKASRGDVNKAASLSSIVMSELSLQVMQL